MGTYRRIYHRYIAADGGCYVRTYEYARDYAYSVARRLVKKRYVWKSDMGALIRRYVKKYDMHQGKARIHYLDDYHLEKYGISADGSYCPVVYIAIGHYEGNSNLEYIHYEKCRYCNSRMMLRKGVIFDKYCFDGELNEYIEPFSRIARTVKSSMHRLRVDNIEWQCENDMCNEALNYMRGNHSAFETAKRLGMSTFRPMKKWREPAPSEDKLAIAAAALLDFEARALIKQIALEERKQ